MRDQVSPCSTGPSTFPQTIAGRVGYIRSTISAAFDELQALSIRNHGPVPECATASGADANKPNGLFAAAHSELDSLEALANRLHSLAIDLNGSH